MNLAQVSDPHLYPLERSAALFLAIIGLAIVFGAGWFKWRNILLIVGALLATFATALSAFSLSAPYGPPSVAQVAWLVVAVVFEVTTLAVVIRRVAPCGERPLVLAILMAVGVHFFPMAPAFGPLVAILGLCCIINALFAFRFVGYGLPMVWAVDGLMKISFAIVVWAITV